MAETNEVECSKCKKEVKISEVVVFAGKFECYECWEEGIDKERAKELRKELGRYIKFGRNEPREGLDEGQLRRVKQIIKNNYFGESNKKSKEILKAMVFMNKGSISNSVDSCLERIEEEIKRQEIRRRLLEQRISKPQPKLKTYTLNCPTCAREFYCELEESNTSEKEANKELSEQLGEHIQAAHKKKREKENEGIQNKHSVDQTANQISEKPNEKEKRFSLTLIIIALLFLGGGIITFVLWKNKKSREREKSKNRYLDISNRDLNGVEIKETKVASFVKFAKK